MKPIILLFVYIAAFSMFIGAAEPGRLEKQLRSDLHTILKTRWPAQKATEGAHAYADNWLIELKTSYPDLLPDEVDPTIPTDDQLLKLQAEASHLRRPKPTGEIWGFYLENWKAQRLNPDQRILFRRFLRVVISEAKKQKAPDTEIQRFDPKIDPEIKRLEDELNRLKNGKKANKAPEPTPSSVMPRASSRNSERNSRTEVPIPARVMPAAVVAHL